MHAKMRIDFIFVTCNALKKHNLNNTCMTKEQAETFARDWIDSFNSHDIDAILAHYAEELEFYSPFIQLLGFNDTGKITNREDLRKYFLIGLKTYPDLNFKLHNVFAGINSCVLYYTSVNGRFAAEVFCVNNSGKAVTVYCNYTNDTSVYKHA